MYWGTCKAGPNSETQRCSLEKAVNCYLWSTAKREHLNLYQFIRGNRAEHPANLYKEKIVYKRPGGNGYAPHYDGCVVLLWRYSGAAVYRVCLILFYFPSWVPLTLLDFCFTLRFLCACVTFLKKLV